MQKDNLIFRYKLHHLLFWALLFAAWYFFRYQDYSSRALAARITVLKGAALPFMVYISNFLLIPQLLYKKKYVWFALSFIVFVFSSSVGKMWLLGAMFHPPHTFFLFYGHFKIN